MTTYQNDRDRDSFFHDLPYRYEITRIVRENKDTKHKEVIYQSKESVIRQAKQATSALTANAYGGELAGELEKLIGQRTGGTYGIAGQMENSVKAYGNLYDEIVQGYKNGTRELYVEDENSETGFRKMTMEEELRGIDRAFQKIADRADAKEMIKGEFHRLRTEGGKGLSKNVSKKPQGTDGDAQETAGVYGGALH